uniref:chorismate mutase n=2 Tax=Lotharella globosa TaxID=91324 RepID=A0A7S4DSG4_9EUKA
MTDSISKGKSAAGANSDSKFEYAPLDLNALRGQLVRLEDTIIFGFVERAQFKQNPKAYKPDAIHIKGAGGATQFLGSYFSYFLTENEKVHAAMRRYTSPDEHPFTP